MSSSAFPYDTLGPIQGYRVWRAGRADRPAPHPACRCGVYAADDRDPFLATVRSWFARMEPSPSGDTLVVGPVRMWGRVFEHERGWRAEFAHPAGLYATWDVTEAAGIERLLDRYAIPTLPVPACLAEIQRRSRRATSTFWSRPTMAWSSSRTCGGRPRGLRRAPTPRTRPSCTRAASGSSASRASCVSTPVTAQGSRTTRAPRADPPYASRHGVPRAEPAARSPPGPARADKRLRLGGTVTVGPWSTVEGAWVRRPAATRGETDDR